jgi:hypothetical protein
MICQFAFEQREQNWTNLQHLIIFFRGCNIFYLISEHECLKFMKAHYVKAYVLQFGRPWQNGRPKKVGQPRKRKFSDITSWVINIYPLINCYSSWSWFKWYKEYFRRASVNTFLRHVVNVNININAHTHTFFYEHIWGNGQIDFKID